MYSKNDYRYYLENQLTYSDDFLAHYGVKGMKWKQHKFGLNDPKINGEARRNAGKVSIVRQPNGNIQVVSTGNSKRMAGKASYAESPNKRTSLYRDAHKSVFTIRGKEHMANIKKKETSRRNANEANDQGKKQTARIKSQQAIKAAQERGQTRTEQVKSSQKAMTESRKKTVRSRVNNLRKKYGLYRETPKGKKLKGGGNIYVSHN